METRRFFHSIRCAYIKPIENEDIRWKQRFQNFKKAFNQLEKAVNTPDMNELERQGLIWKK